MLRLLSGLESSTSCSFSDETIAEAERDLPRNLCLLTKSSYGYAITNKCPYMYFADLVVGETTCDGKKKMHVMQLPQSQNDNLSREMWLKEVLLLKERVENEFDLEARKSGYCH